MSSGVHTVLKWASTYAAVSGTVDAGRIGLDHHDRHTERSQDVEVALRVNPQSVYNESGSKGNWL